jgi:hypothetical protein
MNDLSAITATVSAPAGLATSDRRAAGPYQSWRRVALRPVNPALTQLAAGAAAVRRFEAERPGLVVQALLTGVTPEQVVEVLGWELSDLRFAIGRWEANLRKQGQLADWQGAALLAVVHRSG